MKKLYLLLIVGLYLATLISAEANPCGGSNAFLGNYKEGENISLKQVCDTCTYVNVSSIRYPDSSVNAVNAVMTKNGVDYNYTFTNASASGCYAYSVYGDKDGGFKAEIIDFQVTPTGFMNTLGFYLLIIGLSLGLILLGYYAEDATIVILGSFGLAFLGLYFMFNGINGIKDPVYTWAISVIMLALSAYLLVRASQEFLNDN